MPGSKRTFAKRFPASLLLALMLAPAAWLPVRAAEPVAPAELAALLAREDRQRPLLLDVRTPGEYAAGHLPGARLIPHDALEGRLHELDRTRRIVVYCRSGRRSAIAEDLLRARGYDVVQLQGSWQAWQAAGLPIDTSPSP